MWQHLYNSLITNFHLVSKSLLPLLFIQIFIFSMVTKTLLPLIVLLYILWIVYTKTICSLSLSFLFLLHLQKNITIIVREQWPKSELFYLFMWQIKTEYSVEKTMSEEKTVWSVDDEGRGRPCLFSWFWISDWFYFWLIFNQI